MSAAAATDQKKKTVFVSYLLWKRDKTARIIAAADAEAEICTATLDFLLADDVVCSNYDIEGAKNDSYQSKKDRSFFPDFKSLEQFILYLNEKRYDDDAVFPYDLLKQKYRPTSIDNLEKFVSNFANPSWQNEWIYKVQKNVPFRQ